MLDGNVAGFLAELGNRGATDLEGVNEVGIRELDDCSTAQLLDAWRIANGTTRGEVPGRVVAATSIPVSVRTRRAGRRSTSRSSWRRTPMTSESRKRPTKRLPARRGARFGRFALKELNADLEIDAGEGITRGKATASRSNSPTQCSCRRSRARLDADGPLDADQLVLLSATP